MSARSVLLAAILTVALETPVLADYPEKPVRLVIPFPPGGSTGYAAKVLADELQKVLGKPVTLDVKAGNYGINAISELVGRSDGYTLMVGSIITNSMTRMAVRITRALAQSEVFKGLSEATLTKVASVMIVETHEKGETIVREGEHGDRYYLIGSGVAESTRAGFTRKSCSSARDSAGSRRSSVVRWSTPFARRPSWSSTS